MIPNIVKVLQDGRTNFQLGENDNLFDYTYVGNIAHAHILAAAKLLALSRSLKNGAAPAVVEGTEDPLRVDGQPFFITNTTPVYFWDMARAIWAAYARHSQTSPDPSHHYKFTNDRPWVLSKEVAITIATIAQTVTGLIGGKPARLSPASVRYSCMTRYYRPKKAQQALGYRPIWELSEAVERTTKWFWERELEERGKKGQ